MKCDYCDKTAVLSVCRLEVDVKTNKVEHSVYKAFCWEDAVKKGIMVHEEAKTEKPLTLTIEDVAKGTKVVPAAQNASQQTTTKA